VKEERLVVLFASPIAGERAKAKKTPSSYPLTGFRESPPQFPYAPLRLLLPSLTPSHHGIAILGVRRVATSTSFCDSGRVRFLFRHRSAGSLAFRPIHSRRVNASRWWLV